MVDSSSTIRMLCMMKNRGCCDQFCYDGQLNYESRTGGSVLFYANRAMMIFNNSAHDSQAKSRSPLFCGEVGKEQALFQLSRNAMAGVANHDFDGVAACDHSRGDVNLAQSRAQHRFCGIVQQICECPLDSLWVSHHFG